MGDSDLTTEDIINRGPAVLYYIIFSTLVIQVLNKSLTSLNGLISKI